MKATLSLSLLALTAGLAAQDCQKPKACQTSLTSADQPKSRIAKKLAALSDADRKALGKAMADLSECPVGSRIPASLGALGHLYAEAITALDKVASHPKADPKLAKAVTAELAAIRQVAKLNTATIDVIKSLASATGDCCESGKGECCDEAKGGCCDEAKTATTQKKTCFVSLAAGLTKDWGNAAADYNALSAEKKQKLGKAFLVLKNKGFDIGTLMAHGLQKQHDLLGKAVAGMNCPVAGVFAKNAKALEACEASRKCCEAASTRLIAAQKLLNAMPGVVAKKPTAKTGATECESSKAKACPDGAKTKSEIH